MSNNESVQKLPLGFGDQGVFRTVFLMTRIILEASKQPLTRNATRDALLGVSPYDLKGEVQAVFEWVQRNVRYTKDPDGQEYLQKPELLIHQINEQRGPALGDCDDMIMLLLSMLKSIGLPVALRITSYAAQGASGFGATGDFSHVYGLVQMTIGSASAWVPVDPIRPEFVVGSEGPGFAPTRQMDVVVDEAVPPWLMVLSDGLL